MPNLAIKGGDPVRTEPFPWPIVSEDEKKAVTEVVESGVWGHAMKPDSRVTRFEKEFADFHGVNCAISIHGGSTALEVAMRSLGIGDGDEVITPALTWVAPQLAAVIVGADPVFVDVSPKNYCMDPDRVEDAITERTKAIIPVHLGGYLCDMEGILAIAGKHDLYVIEDCAQAHGSRYKGKLVGTMGDMGCFSFEASKIMTAGEGGMIITDDRDRAEYCYSYVNAGFSYGNIPCAGEDRIRWNLRMTDFQAALLSVQLGKLEERKKKRIENVKYLNEKLSGIGGIATLDFDPEQNYYSYVFKYDSSSFGDLPIQSFRDALRAEGIPCFSSASDQLAYHPSLFTSPRRSYRDVHCPEAEKARYKEAVGIRGSGTLLGEKEDMDDIVKAVRKIKDNFDELLS